MYKALNYWVFGGFFGERSPREFIDFAAERGLDGVELTVGDALPESITDAECRQLREYAAKRGISLRTLATGFYWGCSLGSPDAAERRRALDFTRNYLRIGRELGVESVLVIPGYTKVAWDASRPPVSYRDAWELSLESLRGLLPSVHEFQVDLALENVWNRFLLSPVEWKCYLDALNDARIGMYFDTGNCCLWGNPVDYAELLGSRIKAVHLKNFIADDCGGGLHGFGDDLLKGEVDFAALFATLNRRGYTGPYTVEMIPFSRLPDLVLPDPELAVRMVEQLRLLESRF